MKLTKKKKTLVLLKPTESKYADIRSVMDYNRDFSIFYSGVEYEKYLMNCYNNGVRNFLMSFEYVRGKGSQTIRELKDAHLFIDSGAFTYMSDDKFKLFKPEMWELHIKSYLEWIEKHRDIVFAAADLDLQPMLGTEIIDKWRREYFEPFMLRTGIPICMVYHGEDGQQGWEALCQRYPYVGFSLTNDGTDVGGISVDAKFRIAEKYGTLVQGFGSTQTRELPKLPFYTVDSTTWKIGMRYGLLNVWSGSRIIQMKKDQWDTRGKSYLAAYKDIQLDFEKLRADDEPEVIKANVYAFQKAEEYIRTRLRPLMYWKRPKAVAGNMDDLPEIETVFTMSPEQLAALAKKMNINPEQPAATLLTKVVDMMVFLLWEDVDTSQYVANEHAIVHKLHKQYINQLAASPEAEIEQLRAFYKACFSGQKDTMLMEGTTFDRIVRERELYVEDDDREYQESVSLATVKNIIGQHQKAEHGELGEDLDELDDEIFSEVGLEPVRDERGRLIAGRKTCFKPKQLYSNKYPKYACDTCLIAAKCPHYKPGYVCALNEQFKRFDTRNLNDVLDAMSGMANHNLMRMQMAMIQEISLGGAPDPNVTAFINQNMRILSQMASLHLSKDAAVLSQRHTVNADGSSETVTHVRENPPTGSLIGGLLSSVLSKNSKPDMSDEDFINVEPSELQPLDGEEPMDHIE